MKWLWCLLAASLIAGCAGEGAGQQAGESDGFEFGDARTTKDTGGITGVLIDPTIFPVPGATVTLDGQGLSTTTDADGLFVFDELAPGLYILSANATGYLPTQTSAEVAAGEVTRVKLVIAADPRPQPYHETLRFEWFDSAGVTLVDFIIDLTDETFLGNTLPDQCDTCQFFFDTAGPVETYVIEAYWQDSLSDPLGPTSYYWTLADGEDWTNQYEDGYFRSGQPARLDDNVFGNRTYMQVKMTGDESWVTYDQEAEIFVTMFYIGAAPEGWSLSST